jgi:hypothetical protein
VQAELGRLRVGGEHRVRHVPDPYALPRGNGKP